jgi:hypothetical protein
VIRAPARTDAFSLEAQTQAIPGSNDIGENMAFVKYRNIEKLGAAAVKGLAAGKCYIFPKVEGVNAALYNDDGKVVVAIDGKPTNGETPFDKYLREKREIGWMLDDFPQVRLYGVWVPKSDASPYKDDCQDVWYVTDACVEEKRISFAAKADDGSSEAVRDSGHDYLPYDVYKRLLDKNGVVKYVEPLKVIDGPTDDQIKEVAEKGNTWHMKKGIGEGVIVKNYEFAGEAWAEYDRPGYVKPAASAAAPVAAAAETGGDGVLEEALAAEAVTGELIDKVAEELKKSGKANPGTILEGVWKAVIDECLYEMLRKHKNPTIDFKWYRKAVEKQIKEVRPEIFGIKKH